MNSDRLYPTAAETLKDNMCKKKGEKQLILCFNSKRVLRGMIST